MEQVLVRSNLFAYDRKSNVEEHYFVLYVL